MKAILIDPKACSVSEVEWDGKLPSLYRELGCTCVEAIRLPRGGCVYLDEEGRLKGERYDLFYIEGEAGVYDIYGRSLVVGSDGEGGDVDSPFSVEEIQERVRFMILEIN